MLLIDNARLNERRAAVQRPLASLQKSLEGELAPALDREIYVPREKALLSRTGGRCERDGANLEFDPFSPKSHRCPSCGSVHEGELHERAWNTWYHLWLAERTVHASLLHVLVDNPRHAAFARTVLRRYADVYLDYPNRENVLGPTRPFFSTYLESIWLLQLCVAADLVEHTGDHETADIVRERIVEPSSALIAGFDEGNSNRQVWNNAALLASALLQRDKRRAAEVVHAKSGVAAHLTQALLSDGTWFEGDNYHQFAIRGLWYAVAMCEANGVDLPAKATKAFDRGVAATFASALPDFTFPSRKDSQYAVSLRQWRFAELAELGFARTRDDHLGGALARCYEAGHERRDTGRSRSTADAERNAPSSLLTRADLGWRSLLHALPELPELHVVQPRSVHLAGQGLAIFRRPGDIFVAMDYGQSGAGHGHPDRLNLLLAQGDTRWLDDLGTGSYVEQTLHWYRSSLAHNAPLVNGRSQHSGHGSLRAYDDRGDIGWVEARFEDGEVELTRTLVVTPGYLVDELAWSGPADVTIDLPWHLNASVEGVSFAEGPVDGGAGLEDGFDFATDWETGAMPTGAPVHFKATTEGRSLAITTFTKSPATLHRACGPGQPASKKAPFYMVRLHGAQGRLRTVVAWDAKGAQPLFDGDVTLVETADSRESHIRTPSGWRVEMKRGSVRDVAELGGRVSLVPKRSELSVTTSARTRIRQPTNFGGWWSELSPADRKQLYVVELGEMNYRRTEESWLEAGSPTATVAISAADRVLELFIDVRASGQRFAQASAVNQLDNEHADTMGAGVQVHIDTILGRGMWMLIPEVGSERVRIREIAGSTYPSTPVARWRTTDHGYELHIELPFSMDTFDVGTFELGKHRELDLTVVINDAVEGRERRRGQLVTGDARDEFAYLRGDREDGSHALHLDVAT